MMTAHDPALRQNLPYVTVAGAVDVVVSEPNLDHVTIRMIAASLSKQCRYNGHVTGWYSVARHSVIAARAAWRAHSKDAAKALLMHDAHEAIMGDIASPVGTVLGSRVNMLKIAIDNVIEQRFNVRLHHHKDIIADIDRELLYWEWKERMQDNPERHGYRLPDTRRIDAELIASIRRSTTWEADKKEFIQMAEAVGLVV